MAINAGDAVLKFTADTTQLDQAYNKIQGQATESLGAADGAVKKLDASTKQTTEDFTFLGQSGLEAGNEVAAGADKAAFSMHEAKGETALLGEETGIKLPRHVRNFVAELPGVGQALSAAFEATAVLFLIQAVVEITEKVSNFISETFIYTAAMKEADAATGQLNTTILQSSVALAQAKAQFEALGLEGSAKTKAQFQALQDQVEKLTTELNANKDAIYDVTAGWNRNNLSQAEAQKKANDLVQANKALANQILALQYQEGIASDQYTKDLQKEADAAEAEAARELAAHFKVVGAIETLNLAEVKLRLEREKSREALAAEAPTVDYAIKLIYTQADAIKDIINVTPEVNAHLAAMAKQFDKTDIAWGKFLTNVRGKAPTLKKDLHDLGDVGKDAFLSLGNAVGSAAKAIALGQGTIGQALKQGLQAELATIAERAEVKAIEELAYGFATLFTNPAESAGHFTSAALFGTLGAATAVAGHALGKSAPVGSATNPAVTTTADVGPVAVQQQPVSTQNVQRFATGGLISAPTLAVIGDARHGGAAQEAVIPLDDDQATSKLREKLGGGGVVHHNYIKGDLVNYTQLTRKLNQQTRGRQVRLLSSKTFKETRRA